MDRIQATPMRVKLTKVRITKVRLTKVRLTKVRRIRRKTIQATIRVIPMRGGLIPVIPSAPMSAGRRYARMATTLIIPIPAPLMAITVRSGLRVESLLVSAPGMAGAMADIMVARATTGAAITDAATPVDTDAATLDAATPVDTHAGGTHAGGTHAAMRVTLPVAAPDAATLAAVDITVALPFAVAAVTTAAVAEAPTVVAAIVADTAKRIVV